MLSAMMADSYYYFVMIKEPLSDEVLGFANFLEGAAMEKGCIKLTILAVKQRARRKGLASCLINSPDQLGIPFNKIIASTRPSNSSAINAYLKCGFVEDEDAANASAAHFIKDHWVHLVRTR